MRNDFYPKGTVQALMQTDKVTLKSRNALQKRIDAIHDGPKFFDEEIFVILQAVCMRLIPQPDEDRMVDLAGCLDAIIAERKGNGWRYDAMPADGKAFIIGLYGIKNTSVSMFGKNFHLLNDEQKEEVLLAIQSGTASGLTWQIMSSKLFFEDLLAALVELYYSHPYAKEDIGEVAMADAKGWKNIGLNELENHEPEKLKTELYGQF
jgi:hypothetical protein